MAAPVAIIAKLVLKEVKKEVVSQSMDAVQNSSNKDGTLNKSALSANFTKLTKGSSGSERSLFHEVLDKILNAASQYEHRQDIQGKFSKANSDKPKPKVKKAPKKEIETKKAPDVKKTPTKTPIPKNVLK